MTHYLELDGEMVSAKEYCRKKSLSYDAVRYRVKTHNETYEQAIKYYEENGTKLIKIHLINCDGELISVKEYCRRKNLNYRAIQYRVRKYSETYEQAITYYESKENKHACIKYLVNYNGNLISVAEYCRIRGISISAVYNRRLKTGDSFEDILAYYEENGGRINRQRGIIKDLRLYNIWQGMVSRCTNPKCKSFKKYSKLGMQESWLDFENFQNDMYEEYLACLDNPNDLPSIDRKNNDIGYFKENCRWIPKSMQNRNQDRNLWVSEDELLIDYCERKGLRYDTILNRLHAGYTLEEAESMPMPKYKGKNLEYVGKNIKEFKITKLKGITPNHVIGKCNICGEEISLSLYDLLHRNLNKGCSCRKGHKFYIGDNNYTYKELETLYSLSHEEIKNIIKSGNNEFFKDIENLSYDEWINLLKDIHSKW